MDSTAIRRFNRLCLSTLIAVYFLIMVGGVVRSTGSGMGCPDWPKCFGQWVPPTSVEQLPANYKEVYSQYRDKKNQKFARYLSYIGLEDTADRILQDKAIKQEADFNPAKTLVEYLNRLVGVTIGGFIIVLFLRSIKFRKTTPAIFFFSTLTLITVLIQGWFGSIVVSTNLTTWTITIHMLIALLIVAFLVYLYHLSVADEKEEAVIPSQNLKLLLIVSFLALFIQVVLGTKVREAVDVVASVNSDRSQWIDSLGIDFLIHRSFSWIVLIAGVILSLKLTKTSYKKALSRTLIILILSTFLTGVGMAYMGILPVIQPVHLLLATVTLGVQLFMIFDLNSKRRYRVE